MYVYWEKVEAEVVEARPRSAQPTYAPPTLGPEGQKDEGKESVGLQGRRRVPEDVPSKPPGASRPVRALSTPTR